MKIYKDKDTVGQWVCDWRDKTGHYFVSCGKNKTEALNRMFEKLQWADIGLWKVTK